MISFGMPISKIKWKNQQNQQKQYDNMQNTFVSSK